MNNDNEKKPVVVRIAPSPTGNLHIGTARTALFNYLFAQHMGGKFILRIEDTDKGRSKIEYEKNIMEGLAWIGITHDEFYRQSERGEVYKKHIDRLIESGLAYISEEKHDEADEKEAEDRKEKKTEVIRFKNPGRRIIFHDIIRGDIEFDTTELGNFVIAKDIDTPLYHFAVVVDDYEMGVTHIIRGEDHISNTTRQILIQEALGAPRPQYAHIPLILASDRTKLSKRHGATALIEYRDRGYLPEAITNYLALLGWNPGGEQEIFSLQELAERFDLAKIQKAGAIFDVNKFNWFNREYLLKLSHSDIEKGIMRFIPLPIKELPGWNENTYKRLLPVLIDRIHVFGDVSMLADDGEIDYFFQDPKLDKTKISLKKSDKKGVSVDNFGVLSVIKFHLEHVVDLLSNIPEEPESFTAEDIKNAVWEYATEHGRGNVLWPMRYALTGREKSPDPFTVAYIIGKDATIRRLSKAAEMLA